MTFHSLVVAHSHPDRQIHVISIGCLEDDMKISDKSKVICVYFSWKSRTNQSRCICQCYSKTTFSIRISHLNFLLLILATLGTEFFFFKSTSSSQRKLISARIWSTTHHQTKTLSPATELQFTDLDQPYSSTSTNTQH